MISGNAGDDAKRHEERNVRKAIEAIDENNRRRSQVYRVERPRRGAPPRPRGAHSVPVGGRRCRCQAPRRSGFLLHGKPTTDGRRSMRGPGSESMSGGAAYDLMHRKGHRKFTEAVEPLAG